jgi:hypothetical protein
LATKGYPLSGMPVTTFKIRDEINTVSGVYAMAVETGKFMQGVMYFLGDPSGVEILYGSEDSAAVHARSAEFAAGSNSVAGERLAKVRKTEWRQIWRLL